MSHSDVPRPSGGLITIAALGTRALNQFVLLLLLTRSGGVDSSRDFILLTALIAPVQPIAELGLRLQFVLRPTALPLRPVLELRLLGYLALNVFVGGFALYAGIAPLVIAGVLLAKSADGVADIAAGHLQRARGLSVPSRVTLGTSLASMGALGVATLTLLRPGLLPLVTGLASSCGAMAMWWLVARNRGVWRTHERDAPRTALLVSGLRMGLGGSLAGLAAALPQFALGAAGQDVALTAFAYLAYCLTAADLMVNGLSQARLAQLAQASADKDWPRVSSLALRNSVTMMLRVGGPGLAGLLVTSLLVRHGAGLDAGIGTLDLVLMMTAILTLPIPYMYASALTAMDATGQVLVAATAGAVAVGLVCLFVVPQIGLTGATLAVAVGGLTRSGGAVWLLERRVRRESQLR
jgi:O-antigen/teichoic acid export membrane protein